MASPDRNNLTKDVTVRLVELLDAIDDAVERGAPQLGGFDFSALSVAHEEIIRLRTAVEPEHKILSWLKANARKGRSTVSINVAANGDITLDNLHDDPSRVLSPHRIDPYRPASTADAPPSTDSTAPNRGGDGS